MKNNQVSSDRKIDLLAFNETVDREDIYKIYGFRQAEEIFKKNKGMLALLSNEEIENKFNEKWEESCLYWSKCKNWKLEEITLILLKIDPRIFRKLETKVLPETKVKIKRYLIKVMGEGVLKRYEDILGQLEGCHSGNSLDCMKAIEWAKKMKISFPEELAEMVRRFNNVLGDKEEIERLRLKVEELEGVIKKNNQEQERVSDLSNKLNRSQEMLAAIINDKFCKDGKPVVQNIISSLNRGGLKKASKEKINNHYERGNALLK